MMERRLSLVSHAPSNTSSLLVDNPRLVMFYYSFGSETRREIAPAPSTSKPIQLRQKNTRSASEEGYDMLQDKSRLFSAKRFTTRSRSASGRRFTYSASTDGFERILRWLL